MPAATSSDPELTVAPPNTVSPLEIVAAPLMDNLDDPVIVCDDVIACANRPLENVPVPVIARFEEPVSVCDEVIVPDTNRLDERVMPPDAVTPPNTVNPSASVTGWSVILPVSRLTTWLRALLRNGLTPARTPSGSSGI